MADFDAVFTLFLVHRPEVDQARPCCRPWIAVDGYRRREGQGTVVAWRITPRPEHRAAVLVSIQEIRRKAILGASKDFRLIVGFEAICLKPRKIDNGRRTTKVEYAL